MNIVFWLLVIIALVGVWFILTPLFSRTGGSVVNIFKRVEKEIEDKDESEDN